MLTGKRKKPKLATKSRENIYSSEKSMVTKKVVSITTCFQVNIACALRKLCIKILLVSCLKTLTDKLVVFQKSLVQWPIFNTPGSEGTHKPITSSPLILLLFPTIWAPVWHKSTRAQITWVMQLNGSQPTLAIYSIPVIPHFRFHRHIKFQWFWLLNQQALSWSLLKYFHYPGMYHSLISLLKNCLF